MRILRGWGTWIVVAAVVAVGVLAAVVALRSSDEETSASATTETRASTSQPSATTTGADGSASASQPGPTPTGAESSGSPPPAHPFAAIHGWIVYGVVFGDERQLYDEDEDEEGIWAIDPTRPGGGGRPRRIRLSEQSGEPVAWSRDGSKLLIFRRVYVEGKPRATVSLLNANGVVKKLKVLRTKDLTSASLKSASLSPDGLQVVYSTFPLRAGVRPHFGIYLADVDGGGARRLKALHRRWYASEKRSFRTQLFAATFSPDGDEIAYVDGMGDWGNSIRVMDADGDNVRVLVDWARGSMEKGAMDNFVNDLAWSPDGSRLAFESDEGIWVVGSDGTGLRLVIRHGRHPAWSPDGSRLAFATGDSSSAIRLRIGDADGSHAHTLAHIGLGPLPAEGSFIALGPWNPSEPAGR